jgi:ribosomal-protein-alanine N-acetyltransferase
MSLPESFATARLRAERLDDSHLTDLERFHRDPAVMAELGGVRGQQETRDYLARNLAHWSRFGFGVWMLAEIGGTEFVGRALLRHIELDGVDEIEIGYALNPDLWGRGLATEIGGSCVALARDALRLRSLIGVTTTSNRASQQVLTKLGMDLEREIVLDGTRCLLHRIHFS